MNNIKYFYFQDKSGKATVTAKKTKTDSTATEKTKTDVSVYQENHCFTNTNLN